MNNKLSIVLFVGLLLVGAVNAADKYVTPTGAGSHNGQLGNEWTIYEAAANVVAGDTVHLAKGNYVLNSILIFSKAGTSTNPIVWEGEISQYDLGVNSETADGTQSTVLRNLYEFNGGINMNANYNTFKNMVFQQDTPGKVLMYVKGDYVTLDSTASKYPGNSGSGSNHLILVYGEHVTFRYSSFYNGPRTIIWVRKNSGSDGDYFTLENCIMKGAKNHYDIQIMPTTTLTNPTIFQGLIIRNNKFVDNPYESAIYLRHDADFKIYNNVFVNSGGPVHYVHHPVEPIVSVDTANSIFAFNTIYDTTHSTYWFKNNAANNWMLKNNLFIFDDGYGTGDLTLDFRCGYSLGRYGQALDYNSYYYPGKNLATSGYIIWGEGTSACKDVSYQSFNSWKSATGMESHGIFDVATSFVDLQNLNLKPVSGSAVIGSGTPIPGITTDINGNPRDPVHPTIGAYEYGSAGDGGSTIYSPADSNHSGCISAGEISNYVGEWLHGLADFIDVNTAVNTWLHQGCTE